MRRSLQTPVLVIAFLFAGSSMLTGCADRSPLFHDQPIVSEAGDAKQFQSDRAALLIDEPRRPAWTDPDSSQPITLSGLFELADIFNPSLAASRSAVGIARGEVWQASLYPNPSIGISVEDTPFRTGPKEATTLVTLSQPIVLGDRLRASVAAAKAHQAASRAQVEIERRKVFGQITHLHARLLAIRSALELSDELETLGSQTLEIAQIRFDAGAAPENEILRPQIELYQIRVERDRLLKEKESLARQLSLLVGDIAIDVNRLSGDIADQEVTLDFDALEALLQRTHPAIVAADFMIEAAEAQLEKVRARRVPDLELHVGVGYSGEGSQGIYELGAGIELPIWNRQQGDLLAARFALMRARQQRQATLNELLSQLAQAKAAYESAVIQLTMLRDELLPAATRSYEFVEQSYRAGRSDFLEVLESQRTLAQTRSTLIDLSSDAARARASIVQIVGHETDLLNLDHSSSEQSSVSTTNRP